MTATSTDLTGQRFGLWVVLRRAPARVYDGRRQAMYWCRCECGTKRAVPANDLRRGRSLSCGCVRHPAPAPETCRHCGYRKARPQHRGLCLACGLDPGIRVHYPSGSRFAHQGVGNDNRARPLPEPTDVLPGKAKVAVLAQRAAAEQRLWNPEDAKPKIA